MRSQRSLSCFAALLALCAGPACGSPTPSDAGDAGTNPDVADTSTTDASADAPPADTMMNPTCGDMRPNVSGISGSEGLVIAADGTIYYSQSGAVGRVLPPYTTQEDNWVAVGAIGGTIWGIALDPPRHQLYVGSPDSQAIFVIDLTADMPMATRLVSNAGAPNGLTMGPDGMLYYSDFAGGHVYRVDPTTMMRTRVTTSTIAGANGVAFAADGSLYVDSYMGGSLIKLTLASGMEAMRQTVATGLGAPDGLAFDAMGGIYVTDNSGGRLFHLDPDGSNRMTLHTGIPAGANIEFGAGALRCTDIYVASSGALYRYEMGTVAGAMVPWHR